MAPPPVPPFPADAFTRVLCVVAHPAFELLTEMALDPDASIGLIRRLATGR